MASNAVIRTGLVGFGLAGRVFHEPFLATNPAFRLEVIATGNPERQEEARARGDYEIVRAPDALLGRDLDLIVLASPPAAHFAQATAALESGAAVVVDKPFAASVAEAEQLIDTAERVGRPLIVFQNRRWDGDFLTAKKLIESGRLGQVFRFESTFERYAGAARDRWHDTATVAQGAGITFDLGSHLVDQALHLFGPATLERAELRVVRPGGPSEDDAFLSLAHVSGVTSHITVSRMAAQTGPRFRVLGTDSAYMVYGLDNQEDALKLGARPTDAGFGVVPEEDWGLVGGEKGAAPTPHPTERGNYAGFYAGVAKTLTTGAPSPVDPREALATMRILELAHQLSA
ncbi:putative dehydrogenase [Glaciihabitans tibetensis]|uniref:Putative dehydrogenase n=1 Tax=Glaciihabitans tibetensis TaxID=1266600 RepID=A0A2T0VJ71_9MICO|nr:Gfo/Idh/MocA family oxidoreductase [Glaciihabitans tibetensis]PRY70239.1 putative dehydrogenase [Glaciihabitans tibetensis]